MLSLGTGPPAGALPPTISLRIAAPKRSSPPDGILIASSALCYTSASRVHPALNQSRAPLASLVSPPSSPSQGSRHFSGKYTYAAGVSAEDEEVKPPKAVYEGIFQVIHRLFPLYPPSAQSSFCPQPLNRKRSARIRPP
jgi:hypothetical protein